MGEALFELLGEKVTITAFCGAAAFLVLVLFMTWWLLDRKKRTGLPIFAGQVMNGIGFGLLPSLAVLKAFQEMTTGKGSKIIEPLPLVTWLSEDGFYMPARIETVAAAACFVILCIWLILRKDALPDNGDLFVIALCVWAVIRLETEDFRREPQDLFRYTSWGTVFISVLHWSRLRMKARRMPVRTVMDILAVSICIAVNIVTAEGMLSVGSDIGDFAVKTGSAGLGLILTLMIGGDQRWAMKRKASQPEPPVQQQQPPPQVPQTDGQETIRIVQQG